MTALGILLLLDDGRLTLGDFDSRYLPEFESVRTRDSNSEVRPPVIMEALTHTAGFPYERAVFDYDSFPGMSLEEVAAEYAASPLDAAPGPRFGHSSPGFDILGRIIEVVSEQDSESFLRDRVFEPLGMTDTAFRLSPTARARLSRRYARIGGQLTQLEPSWPDEERQFPAPAFGMSSTAADLAAVMQVMLNGGTHRGTRLVSEAAVGTITTNQVPDPELTPHWLGGAVGGNLGLDWDLPLASVRVFGHGGASGLLVWPELLGLHLEARRQHSSRATGSQSR